ncbi:MAG: DUF1697 domain-containing protein [Streptosporangiaceae bacterium]
MVTHIALLRGINLGGHKRVAMPELREVVAGLGHTDVATYIQSGNVLFTPAQAGNAGPAGNAGLAAELEQAIAAKLGVQARVLVLSREELAQVAAGNPYPGEPDPKNVHVIFLPGEPEPGHADWLATAQQQAADKGSRDEVQLVGRAVFLHTPAGFGRSELANLLSKAGGPSSARGAGTARNWSTVTKLLALCDS